VIRRRLVVHGAVQGVGFRVSCAERARTRGVAGWVRNRGDGTVEIVVEGAREQVDALVAWCSDGPRGARVDGVEVVEEEPEGLERFEIR
jgi:acylphosphatase